MSNITAYIEANLVVVDGEIHVTTLLGPDESRFIAVAIPSDTDHPIYIAAATSQKGFDDYMAGKRDLRSLFDGSANDVTDLFHFDANDTQGSMVFMVGLNGSAPNEKELPWPGFMAATHTEKYTKTFGYNELLCRDLADEPVIAGLQVGRLVGMWVGDDSVVSPVVVTNMNTLCVEPWPVDKVHSLRQIPPSDVAMIDELLVEEGVARKGVFWVSRTQNDLNNIVDTMKNWSIKP